MQAETPRWLFDSSTTPNAIYVVHTQSPRFVARMHYEEEAPEETPVKIDIDAGWLAVPIEWFDKFDRTTFNMEEMRESLGKAWKWFDRDND